jgi:transposase
MLGVDVGKAQLHGTWRDPATRAIGWQGVVPNNAGGIRQLLRRVPSGGLVVEPTGRYGEALIRAAQAAGREVLLAPGRSCGRSSRGRRPIGSTAPGWHCMV